MTDCKSGEGRDRNGGAEGYSGRFGADPERALTAGCAESYKESPRCGLILRQALNFFAPDPMIRCPQCKLSFLSREIESKNCPSCSADLGEDVRILMSRRAEWNAEPTAAPPRPSTTPPIWQVVMALGIPALIAALLFWMYGPEADSAAKPDSAGAPPASVPTGSPQATGGNQPVPVAKPATIGSAGGA